MYDIVQREINSVNGLGDPGTTTTTTTNATKGQWWKDNAINLLNTAGNVAAGVIQATKTGGGNTTYVGGDPSTYSPYSNPYYTPVSTSQKETDYTPFIIGGAALLAVVLLMNNNGGKK